jgi:hypothetical protein
MSEIERILALFEERGPLAYRALPPEERAWRGRYVLMVATLGGSAAFAWANGLGVVDTGGTASEITELDEDPILAGLIFNGVEIEDLLTYD